MTTYLIKQGCRTEHKPKYSAKIWLKDGKILKMHREFTSGSNGWLNADAKWHREDGPAFEYADGTKRFFLDGIEYDEHGYAVEMNRRNFMKATTHVMYIGQRIQDIYTNEICIQGRGI